MSEKLSNPAPRQDKMPGKELELYKGDVRPDEVPEGAQTTAEIEAKKAAEQAEAPDVKLERLEAELNELRTELARIGAKRGTRVYVGKNGKTVERYDLAHGKYTKIMQELMRAKLESADEFKGMSDVEKKFQAMKLLDDEWAELRQQTTANMEGTFTGKLVKWLGNKEDGKVKRISKLVLFGAVTTGIAVGAGAFTGGAGFGAAAGAGIGLGLRGYRGYVSRSSREGRALDDHTYGNMYDLATQEDSNLDSILSAGAEDGSYTENVTANQKRSRNAALTTAAFMAGGATAGALFDHFNVGDKIGSAASSAWNTITDGNNTAVVVPPTPGLLDPSHADKPGQSGASFRAAEERSWSKWLDYEKHDGRFIYNKNENPFFKDGKPSLHSMGPALESRPELDMGIDGWNDLVQDRWVNSPEQFASVVSAMGIDGLPSDINSADALAEHFKVTPSAHADMHAKVIDLLNQPTTHVYEAPIENDYASEYGVGNNATGDVDLAWDDEVAQRGHKIIIEFKDPNTGEIRKIELRKECGGQRIVEKAPVIVEQPVHYAPTHSTPNYPTTPNHPTTPTTPNTPITPDTPTTPNTPDTPVTPDTPLAPKGTAHPHDQFDVPQGPGEERPPAVVASDQQTNGGGRQTGTGQQEAPVREQFTGPTGAQAGAQAPDATRDTVTTSGGGMTDNHETQTNGAAGTPAGPAV